MRSIVLTLCFACSALAGASSYGAIDDYDPASGLYYKAVYEKGEGRAVTSKSGGQSMVNLMVFDPQTGRSSLLFRQGGERNISSVLFETGFKEGAVQFDGAFAGYSVKNNAGVAVRPLRDKLLVAVYDSESEVTTLSVASKRGEGLRVLATVPKGASWHIDAKNSKLRIVHSTPAAAQVESFDW